MKAIVLLLLCGILVFVSASCYARGGISGSRTGGGISTPLGGLSGAIRY